MVEARLQQPRANVLVATGAYDGVIRLWSSTDGALLSFFQVRLVRSKAHTCICILAFLYALPYALLCSYHARRPPGSPGADINKLGF